MDYARLTTGSCSLSLNMHVLVVQEVWTAPNSGLLVVAEGCMHFARRNLAYITTCCASEIGIHHNMHHNISKNAVHLKSCVETIALLKKRSFGSSALCMWLDVHLGGPLHMVTAPSHGHRAILKATAEGFTKEGNMTSIGMQGLGCEVLVPSHNNIRRLQGSSEYWDDYRRMADGLPGLEQTPACTTR
eukprot:1704687-Amphidinium_carterae.1